MAKIIGNTTATPNPRPDWNQTDTTKADYIKNKPTSLSEFANDMNFINQEDIDQTYDPESENPQSGKAVAEAIGDIDEALDGIIEMQNALIGGDSE